MQRSFFQPSKSKIAESWPKVELTRSHRIYETKTEISLIVQFDGRRVDLLPGFSTLAKLCHFVAQRKTLLLLAIVRSKGSYHHLSGNTKAESYSGIEAESLTSARLTLKA